MADRERVEQKSCLVPVLILILGTVEVLILYLLITVESPVAPAARKAIRNPFGLIAVVMSVVTILSFAVAGALSLVERSARRRDGSAHRPLEPGTIGSGRIRWRDTPRRSPTCADLSLSSP